jgi:ATP adenylyltransferase
MIDCIFCDNQKEIIVENEAFYVGFDDNPVTPGHAIVVAKRHVLNLLDLDQSEWLLLKAVLQDAVRVIEGADFSKLYQTWMANHPSSPSADYWKEMLEDPRINRKPDGYNFGNNQGEAAGRSVHHLHIHIIPRRFGDVPNPRGGVRNIIPNKGDY